MKIIIAPSPRGRSHGTAITLVTESKGPMPNAMLDVDHGTFQTHTTESIEITGDSAPVRLEYRAVFSYPPSILGASKDTYGPERATQKETEQDRPWRPEESLGWRSGTQVREVSPWRAI